MVPDLTGVTVDAVLPAASGLANDSVYKRNKNWTWSCSKANCTYRFVVDTNPLTAPAGAYAATAAASQLGGDGTYYLHVQARDSVGNESAVGHFSALLDNTAPNFSGVVDVSNDGATTSQAVVADWSATVSSDALSGVAKIEIAVGRDLSDDGLDAGERNNVVDWREIPGGLALDPARYQIRNGVDGFSIDLTNDVGYFISLRLEDAVGNKSAELSSRKWGIFNPLSIAGLELWLDGQDLSTLFQEHDCTNDVTTDGHRVGCWRDKSGGNHHAIQSDNSKKPVYRTGGHIHFNNSSDILSAGNVLSGNYDELFVFIVFQQNSDPAYTWPTSFNLNWDNNIHCDNNGASRVSAHMIHQGSIYWDFGSCTGNRRLVAAANANNNTRNFYHLGNSATDNLLFIRKNGNLLGSANVSHIAYTSSGSQAIIGNGISDSSGKAIAGEISEFLVYSEHLDTTDREKLEGYLACKWGLQADLTGDHPYRSNCP